MVADEVFDKMIGGEAAMAPYYNGDAVTMIADNPDLAFSIPMEGSNLFTDCLCIPKESQKRELAEMYINFMLEPEVGPCQYRGHRLFHPQYEGVRAAG